MSSLRKFLLGTAGNTTIIFALSIVPILLVAGAAVDMVRSTKSQTMLQGAADAAALAAGVSGAKGEALDKIVKDYLVANGAEDAIAMVDKIEAKSDKTAGTITISVKGKMKTSFMKLGGINTFDIDAMSEVTMGVNSMEVVLVLDTTDSMNFEGRLDALKDSAEEFVDEIYKDKGSSTYVKVGIVPFANYVNIGTAAATETWLNVPASAPTEQCYDSYPNATKSNCRNVTNAYTVDGVATSGQSEECDWNYGAAAKVCSTHTPTWQGCVGSRNSPLDSQIGEITTPYPALLDTYCAPPITDLTDDSDKLEDNIKTLYGTGSTYIPAGLLWGWNMLDNAEPLSSAKSMAEMQGIKGKKAIVLMTDGDNTLVPTYPHHSTSIPAPVSDAKLLDICSNIKDAGILIYTVAFKVASSTSLDMLKACASDPNMAHDAGNNANLVNAFKEIAQELSALRLSK